MSEKITGGNKEQQHSPHHKHEASRENEHKSHENSAESHRHKHAENIDHIRASIEASSHSRHEKAHDSEQKNVSKESHHGQVSKELKDMTYRRTLRRTQAKLPAPVRSFSRIVHHPVVENVSEFTGKTVARPSGILAGGIFALLGSTAFLWIARHYGYEYNYLLSALLFLGGFFVGLLVELGLNLSKRR